MSSAVVYRTTPARTAPPRARSSHRVDEVAGVVVAAPDSDLARSELGCDRVRLSARQIEDRRRGATLGRHRTVDSDTGDRPEPGLEPLEQHVLRRHHLSPGRLGHE